MMNYYLFCICSYQINRIHNLANKKYLYLKFYM